MTSASFTRATGMGPLPRRRSIRSVGYHASGCEFNLEVSGRFARWGFRALEPISFGRRHHAEHVVYPVIQAMRGYLGPNWSPACVEVEADRPAGSQKVEDLLGAPVVFGADTNAVVFDASLLERPTLRRIPLKDLVTWSDLRRIVMQRPPRTSIEAAREIVRLRLFESTVDIEGAAKLLGLASTRSFERESTPSSKALICVEPWRCRLPVVQTGDHAASGKADQLEGPL